ncbi:MAG: bifunctional diguanylate cyclase/phosphodiesterase [Caulobacterales bacterium 68-7]|nr:MAG: bifunctional diguanylate cyclase/phosphodiesterase [Caulobacterales bacterium 68-7]
MSAVLSSVLVQHDLARIVLAVVVCVCANITAFRLYARVRAATGPVRAAWLLLAGIVAGCGVWSTEFLAFLAYKPAMTTGFAPTGLLYALPTAVFCAMGGFAVAAAGQVRSRSHAVAGGLALGLGVGAAYALGFSALAVSGRVMWSDALIALSLATGIVGFSASLLATGCGRTLTRQMIGGGLFSLTLCILHFTAMAAMTVTPDTTVAPPENLLSRDLVRVAVTSMGVLNILLGLGVAVIEQHLTSSALRRMRRLADAAHEGLVVIRDGRIQDANAAFCHLIRAPIAALIGQKVEDAVLTWESATEVDGDGSREALLQPADGGAEVPVQVFSRVLENLPGEEGETTVLAVRDLRERRAAEEKIRFLADHDGLTGLANRTALHLRLGAAVDAAHVRTEGVALICVDLDRFKECNDLHGQQAGDALLVEAARRLKDCVTAPSFAARLGGDEFVVVQMGVDQPETAAALAGAIVDTLSAPMRWRGHAVPMGASVGVSLLPEDAQTAEDLMANADMALFRAKEQGRNRYCFFKRETDDAVRERRALARDLRRGIAADELVMVYQPQARTADGAICGFEALVRWNHPVRGMVPPLDFIAVAEESGQVAALGEQVLRQACAEAARWATPHRIAVNLSPLQLCDPLLPGLVHEVLIVSGLSPARLELEVTESALFEDPQRALDILRRLKALGVRISMDDFGTGYSSLSTLQSFPFDKLKIDKSFVEQIHRDGRATAIVRAVLGLGRSLGIPVTAEGVETEAQLAFLRAEGCDQVQGYLIGRPSPADALSEWTAPTSRRPRRTRKAA